MPRTVCSITPVIWSFTMIAAEYAGMQSGIAAATAPIDGAKRGAMLRSSRLPQRGQGSPARRKSTAISQTSHDGRRRAGIASRSGRISFQTLPPFNASRPAMVLASAYSLIAILLFRQPGLFLGGTADVILFLAGLTGAYEYLPERGRLGTGIWHDMGVSAAAMLVLVAAISVVLWPLR